MHWLDRAAAASLARTPPDRRVFRDGWGDPDVLAWYRSVVGELPPVPTIYVLWRPFRRHGRLVVQDLVFESPVEHLPPASRLARARVITPEPEPTRLVLLMAAWNEHGYQARSRLASLLAARGVATVILENPLYGSRRSEPADDRPLATVAEFSLMGRAAVEEGRALLRYFHDRGRQVGVGGYSMGGNIAAFVGATVRFPVAIAPTAASHSPGPPFMEGIIRHGVAWEALGDGDARIRLGNLLMSASVLNHRPPEHTNAAVLVAGTIDGFVPTSAVQAIHRHWPGSRMDWVNAGHATLLWRNKDRMAAAIVEAFDRLDAQIVGRERGERR